MKLAVLVGQQQLCHTSPRSCIVCVWMGSCSPPVYGVSGSMANGPRKDQ